ncbi:MAG: RIP metalloprotease RseP [Calditrichaeota bacterium]|nr:MAG: RIP metalloprotease RseP [Calditrichota bacterium]
MLTIISGIFVFGILVIIHELGHFWAARLMGVRVERFSIGMPPVIYSKKIGDTEWCLSAIPLGGYVKMAGFVDESMDTKITGADDEYSSKPVWKRMVIITAGVIMNLLLAMVIYAALSFTQGKTITPVTRIQVEEQSPVARVVGFKTGDKIVSVNDKPVHSWNEIIQYFYDDIDQGVRFKIERDGTIQTLTYKKELLSRKKGELLGISPMFPAKVGEVRPDMPAGKLGLQTGDRIVALDGQPVSTWQEMTEIIRSHPGRPIAIEWMRGDQHMKGTITPATQNMTTSEGKEETYGIIGIGVYVEHLPVSLKEALVYGVRQPFEIIAFNIKGLWWWISGVKTADETIGGPLMIVKMAGDAAEAGWVQLWNLIAALSSVLAFFNILPIPVLDGGHLVFLIIEGITRREVSIKTRLRVQQVGMALLLMFIVFVLFVDVNRLLF